MIRALAASLVLAVAGGCASTDRPCSAEDLQSVEWTAPNAGLAEAAVSVRWEVDDTRRSARPDFNVWTEPSRGYEGIQLLRDDESQFPEGNHPFTLDDVIEAGEVRSETYLARFDVESGETLEVFAQANYGCGGEDVRPDDFRAFVESIEIAMAD